jgi:galactonate dehydratase
VPLFLIHEGYKDRLPEGVARKNWEMDEEGYVSLPQGPGLGVEVDEALAREVGADPSRHRPFAWPDNRLRDGSVADY